MTDAKTPAPKVPATPAERIDAVYNLLVRGATEQQAAATAEAWPASTDEVALLLEAARDRFRRLAVIAEDVERGKALAQLLDLYSRSLRNSDYQRATVVRKALNDLLGLTATSPKSKRAAAPKRGSLDAEIARLEEELSLS